MNIDALPLNEPLSKPLEAIEKLIGIFRTKSQPLPMNGKKNVIELSPEGADFQVIILLQGQMTIYRRADNLLFAHPKAPSIFGMQGSAFRYDVYQFIAGEDAVLESLPLSCSIALIEEHHVMQEFLSCQVYFNDYQAYRSNQLIAKSTYEIVCALLLELEKIPFQERHNISIYQYILTHTGLARSGIMNIISELRAGNYITVEKGKLISIDKSFPKGF